MNKKMLIFSVLLCAAQQINGTPLSDLAASLKKLADTLPPQPEKPNLKSLDDAFIRFARGEKDEPTIPADMDIEDQENAQKIINALKAIKGADKNIETFLEEVQEKLKIPSLSFTDVNKLLKKTEDFRGAIQSNKKLIPSPVKTVINEWDDQLNKRQKELQQNLDQTLPKAIYDAIAKLQTWAKASYSFDKDKENTFFTIEDLNSALEKKGHKASSKTISKNLINFQTKLSNTKGATSLESLKKLWPVNDVVAILNAPSLYVDVNPFYGTAQDIRRSYGTTSVSFTPAVKDKFNDITKLKPYDTSIKTWYNLLGLFSPALDNIKTLASLSKTPAEKAYEQAYFGLIDYIDRDCAKSEVDKEIEKQSKIFDKEKKKELEDILNAVENVLAQKATSCDDKTINEILTELYGKKKLELEETAYTNKITCINNIKVAISNSTVPKELIERWIKKIDEKTKLFISKKAVLTDEEKAIAAIAQYAVDGKTEPTDETLNKADPDGDLVEAKKAITKIKPWDSWLSASKLSSVEITKKEVEILKNIKSELRKNDYKDDILTEITALRKITLSESSTPTFMTLAKFYTREVIDKLEDDN